MTPLAGRRQRSIVLPARAEASNEKVTGRGVRASTPAVGDSTREALSA